MGLGAGAMISEEETNQTTGTAAELEIPDLLKSGFFKNKAKAFWILQTVGWLAYGFLRLFNGLAQGREYEYWKPSVVAMITGFLITLFYRQILR
ncbi:MAG: hypothetical protein V3R20_03145, partial [Sphingomonadales bacterium]